MARHHYETLQQVFDDAYRGLAAQGFVKSRRLLRRDDPQSAVCAYRGADGRRCAIGHCIPDDAYSSEMESKTPCEMPSLKGLDPIHLMDLQVCHDRGRTPQQMRVNLERFASDFGLTIPSIEGAA